MKSTQKAIEDAIKGGWNYRGLSKENGAKVEHASMDDDWFIFSKDIGGHPYRVVTERIVLQPSFWEALGKQRGWNIWFCSLCEQQSDLIETPFEHCRECGSSEAKIYKKWVHHMTKLMPALQA